MGLTARWEVRRAGKKKSRLALRGETERYSHKYIRKSARALAAEMLIGPMPVVRGRPRGKYEERE